MRLKVSNKEATLCILGGNNGPMAGGLIGIMVTDANESKNMLEREGVIFHS